MKSDAFSFFWSWLFLFLLLLVVCGVLDAVLLWCRRHARSIRGVIYLTLLIASAPLAFLLIFLPSFIFATFLRLIGRNCYYERREEKRNGAAAAAVSAAASAASSSSSSSRFGRKTVLVTGAPHVKGLQVCRIMKAVGHRVILADFKRFRWNATRFSAAVDAWIELPDLKTKAVAEAAVTAAVKADLTVSADYEQGVIDAIVSENVDW